MFLLLTLAGCRNDPDVPQPVPTDEFGGAGSGWVSQCSGWFPDWISQDPPPDTTDAFQLAQGYFLGIPIVEDVNGTATIVGWDPPAAASGSAAPWLAIDFHTAPAAYLDALKTYALAGMPAVDFVAQKNTVRPWFHVPMMTTSPFSRREPYHGVTKERALRDSDHGWISGGDLQSYAIGYYNALGSYTIGRVFRDPDPHLADPTAATFIDGAFVFKLLFAEYDATKIDAATYPLDGAPEWQVWDVVERELKPIRLIQVDIAVKDPRAIGTGWVFATYVYDEGRTDPVAWDRLTPVGLQWGNDPDVTGPAIGTVDETWLDPSRPAFATTVGRNGRLNGPVDNPRSACLSCHATAEVNTAYHQGAGTPTQFRGAQDRVPPDPCSDTQDMSWFRNVAAGADWGTSTGTNGCDLSTTPVATLHSLDYSLQLAVAIEASLYFPNPNPCQGLDDVVPDPGYPEAAENGAGGGGSREEKIGKIRMIERPVFAMKVERPETFRPLKVQPKLAVVEIEAPKVEVEGGPQR